MIREFFYLQKSDRKVILSALCVMLLAFGIIIFTGRAEKEANTFSSIDTIRKEKGHQAYKQWYKQHPQKVYVRTKVVYRDTAFRRGHALSNREHDSLVARYQIKISEGEHVILNTADTAALKTVPGIGPYFARKIVQYGQRLGGYVSVDQLDEIEEFPLDAKDYLVVQNASPRKLNINQLSLNELKRHPYINFYQARAITDYRRLHGPIKSLYDLKLSKDFPQEAINRLLPYVAY